MNYITSSWINQHKENLLKFSNITEQDVQKIFICNKDEKPIEDFQKLEYHYCAPLFVKMIFRLRQGKGCPSQLYSGCTPGYQKQLLSYYDLWHYETGELIPFFAWIKNSLSCNDILLIEDSNNKNLDDSEMLKLWENNNSIKFYFLLSCEDQEKFVAKYNKDVVDEWNKMQLECASKHAQ